MLTAQELAPIVGRSPKWLWTMMRTGSIKSVKMGRFRLSSEEWVRASFEREAEGGKRKVQSVELPKKREKAPKIDLLRSPVKDIVKAIQSKNFS